MGCRIHVFWPGAEPWPQQWKHWVLTTGSSEKLWNINDFYYWFYIQKSYWGLLLILIIFPWNSFNFSINHIACENDLLFFFNLHNFFFCHVFVTTELSTYDIPSLQILKQVWRGKLAFPNSNRDLVAVKVLNSSVFDSRTRALFSDALPHTSSTGGWGKDCSQKESVHITLSEG